MFVRSVHLFELTLPFFVEDCAQAPPRYQQGITRSQATGKRGLTSMEVPTKLDWLQPEAHLRTKLHGVSSSCNTTTSLVLAQHLEQLV
jgi:hypothetical protein